MDTNTAPVPVAPEQTPLELMTGVVASLIAEGWEVQDIMDLCSESIAVASED